MTSLPASTRHRLKQLPQIPSVWEGDRHALAGEQTKSILDGDGPEKGDCILWVDGSEGFVRSMDIVSPDMGLEAVVRTLIRAMETPHSPAKPARPQKIVVRNREIQFFLRGALQGLEISIDYVPELPLIDELFRSFESSGNDRPPALPSEYAGPLKQVADALWEAAPWDLLADHDIVAIELEREDVATIYACIMGMLGQEYGVIFYRSLESLKQFRAIAIAEKSTARLEQAFLSQDCWFLNYEAKGDFDDDDDLGNLDAEDVEALFGSIHPLEGIRPFLDAEESQTLYYALQGLLKFFEDHEWELSQEPVAQARQSYRLNPLKTTSSKAKINAEVYTLPELAQEFAGLDEEEDDQTDFVLRDDLIPENAFLSIGMIPWDVVKSLQGMAKVHYQSRQVEPNGEGLPVVMIQTSRPKAQTLIKKILEEGGISGLAFNDGENPLTNTDYDLGILRTSQDHLYIFGEFLQDDATHKKARQKWDKRCQETQGFCGVLIAMGVTGSSRGKPQLSDMLAFFETPFLSEDDLQLGTLQLMPSFDMDW